MEAPGPVSLSADLAAAAARFEVLFRHAPFSVQLLAADGRTLAVNEAWKSLWDATPESGLVDYVLSEYNLLHDPQLEQRGLLPFIHRAFAGESVTTPRNFYDPAEIGRAGRSRWVVAHLHPVRDPASGAVREVVLVHEDVTDRVLAENALRASEERLKQLANTIPQLAWMADPGGHIHWYNDRWYAYTGTTPQQMLGWGWQQVHDPAVLPLVLERWKASLAGGTPFQMTFPLRGADGRYRPFLTLVAPLKDGDGQVVQWFGTNTDVSPLHRAQEELQRTEERLRIAVEAGGIGIWDWDVPADRVSWSERVYELHGVPPGGFGGTVGAFAALIHPEDRAFMGERIRQAMERGEGFNAEFRVVLPDGTPRWLSTWASAHRGPDGRAARMVGATISIDDFKRAEAALREGDRRKDEFLAMLAHELRNPLAPISTAALLLQRFADDAPRVRQAGEIVARQALHMTSLVDDLLDVSRVTRGLIQLKPEPLALDAVASAAVEQVRPLMQARRHALDVQALPGLQVRGDRTRLVQVLVNLLNNAAKYTPEGGRIQLSMVREGERARIRVDDNGSGIEPDLLPRVFELFTQGQRTPDRSQGGLGIGLALVRSLVQMHGGDVTAASAGPGHGSCFEVLLPLATQAEAEAGPAAPARPASVGSRALDILVVDDNADAAQTLAMLLSLQGHRVAVAGDGRTALQMAGADPPRVFILDIGLPDMDGHALARELRRSAAPGSLFIALTGYGQPQDRRASSEAGFDHHLVKPVDPDALEAVLRGPA